MVAERGSMRGGRPSSGKDPRADVILIRLESWRERGDDLDSDEATMAVMMDDGRHPFKQ